MLSDEEFSFIPRLFIYGLILSALVIMVTGIGYAVAPMWMDAEREIQTHSHQYVEARLTEIQNTLAECRTINSQLQGDVSPGLQQALELERATLNDMIMRALSEIPPDSHPNNTGACQ